VQVLRGEEDALDPRFRKESAHGGHVARDAHRHLGHSHTGRARNDHDVSRRCDQQADTDRSALHRGDYRCRVGEERCQAACGVIGRVLDPDQQRNC
jgi:hypothetical protein